MPGDHAGNQGLYFWRYINEAAALQPNVPYLQYSPIPSFFQMFAKVPLVILQAESTDSVP
ncbi:hypothetical protein CLAFUW4_04502 [Fulvia fulva]|uniref:Uncharacterized protein n=1 Tax=Passalora fulva TaxID=5499 RepID=A0A9Q8LEZ7_PASFU|nr:uncharacterized protein CLAFUR5_04465 [Fulvia fulva]KAK4626122.1 hypothetical protein CLAFUR4_04488 [Fulvia fulva]KAK4628566.1 hypothetical protein CLAFUR0_04491 [Fulvia fulva]UJO16326.1 hypothetical protein CLAFUR5_04465 [Fulvia fulva]WPV13228.1 hypothetical protein CLAFUW4_04502 [Fulvia fulva]WPV28310.1 hypothetical protein CLAFUW7_04494 [Fulvia fulva]